MQVEIQHNFKPIIEQMLAKSKDYRQPLTDFYGWMIRRTQLTFSKLGKKGNTTSFRGITWRWFANQYVRKDGTVVPAEGIPGQVKGRLRHGPKRNNRITARSMMMQNNRTMMQSALGRFRIGLNYLVAQTPVKYAEQQQKMRKFVFMTDEDVEYLRKQILKYLTQGA